MKVRKEALDELQAMKTDNDSYIYVFLKNIEQTKKKLLKKPGTWQI
jgi:predicted CopG family antitoxin